MAPYPPLSTPGIWACRLLGPVNLLLKRRARQARFPPASCRAWPWPPPSLPPSPAARRAQAMRPGEQVGGSVVCLLRQHREVGNLTYAGLLLLGIILRHAAVGFCCKLRKWPRLEQLLWLGSFPAQEPIRRRGKAALQLWSVRTNRSAQIALLKCATTCLAASE